MNGHRIVSLFLLSILAGGCVTYPDSVTTGEDGSPCQAAADCRDGNRCIEALGLCSAGRNESPCATDADCSGSCVESMYTCTDGSEGSFCAGNGDCDVGCVVADNECTGGSLSDPCDDASDCPYAEYTCRSDRGTCDRACRSDCDCLSGDFCGSDRFCVASTSNLGRCFDGVLGRACSSSSTCSAIPSGYCSTGGYCARTCTTHWACGCPLDTDDADVLAGLCDAACVDFAEGSFCFATCRTSADCPSGAPTCRLFEGSSVGYCS